MTAQEALARLKAGNARFAQGLRSVDAMAGHLKRGDLVGGQAPFAVILGCSDSRVPVEMVFDQGLGDLFVIRVAGNIVAPSHVGSVEFAAAKFGTRLVVVLGHSRCGAVQATLDELRQPTENQSKNLHAIVERIRPAVAGLLSTDLCRDEDRLCTEAVRANVRVSCGGLRHGSEILEDLIEHHDLVVVGAEYSLETGVVDFFEVPADLAEG